MKTPKIIPIILLLTLLTTALTLAQEPTPQFSKIYLDPLYRNTMSSNTNYYYTINVKAPDNIKNVINAMINLETYMSPTANFNLTVNNKSCNPSIFTVSTTYMTSGLASIKYDCSNIIKQEGQYEITLRTDKNTGATTAWLDLTYINEPSGKITVLGTEYQVNDTGTMFLQLLDNSGNPVNSATCLATIYYPNNTKWIDRSLMTYQTGSNGLYYLDFTAPTQEGVYMTEAICEYKTNSTNHYPQNYTILKGQYVTGNTTSLIADDNQYFSIKETATGTTINGTTYQTLLQANLDELSGTTAYDNSPYQNNGTNYNNVTQGITGTLNTAYSYTGGADYTRFNRTTSQYYLNNTEHLMVCFAFNESVTNANGNTIIDGMNAIPEGFEITFEGGNNIRWKTDRSASGGQSIDTPLTYLDSKWHTFCGYANFTHMSIFIDGTNVITSAKSQTGTINISTHGIILGQNEASLQNAIVGLDEICIFKGTFQGTETPTNLSTNYNTTKSCITGGQTLKINITIDNYTLQNNSIYNILTTHYIWDDSSGEKIDLYLYDYNTSTFTKLNNSLTYNLGENIVSNIINNITPYLNNGKITLLMNDTDPTGLISGQLQIDLIQLQQTYYLETPITTIRGSSELHITNYVNTIIEKINNLTKNLDTNLTEIINQILLNRNLTTQQFENLTNQINTLQNNITLQYQNLTNQLTTITNQNINNSNKIDILTNLSNYNNQIALQNQQLLNQLNQTITNEFNITNTNINNILTNLTNQITQLNNTFTQTIQDTQNIILLQINQSTNLILNQIQNQTNQNQQQFENLTNITTTNQNLLQQILAYLSGFITNTLLGLNQSVNQLNTTITIIDANVNTILNQTNTTPRPNSIFAITDNCITGSDWIIEATVLDQNNNNYPTANCTINTTQFGIGQMNYNPNTTTYTYRNTCPSPLTWNWSINCV